MTFLRAPDPCEVLDAATARETDDQVALLITVLEVPQSDGELCPDVLVEVEVTIELEAPLADRQVIDSSTGDLIPTSTQGD